MPFKWKGTKEQKSDAHVQADGSSSVLEFECVCVFVTNLVRFEEGDKRGHLCNSFKSSKSHSPIIHPSLTIHNPSTGPNKCELI